MLAFEKVEVVIVGTEMLEIETLPTSPASMVDLGQRWSPPTCACLVPPSTTLRADAQGLWQSI